MSRSRPRRGAAVRLRLEPLEGRTLPATSALGPIAIDPSAFDPTRLLVRFRDTAAALPGTRLGGAVGLLTGLRSVVLDAGVTVASALAAYRANPGVVEVTPDYRVHALRTPDDPRFRELWGLNNTGQTGGTVDADIDAPEAWDRTTGSGNVVVAVIDSGVDYTHPDLADNMWRNSGEVAGNGIDDDRNGYVDDVYGFDFANNDGDPMDDLGHGTHIAGIIGARGNNTRGVVGVNWNVKIMALKFLGADGTGNLSGAIAALDYAAAMGATISNNSWGGGGFSQAFSDAIARAGARGHVFVTAAGNDGSDVDRVPSYPACYDLPNILCVAATDPNDRLASTSNFGARSVDLGAPGVDILSTVPRGGLYGNSSGYAVMSGTSMAAAHVAGAVALVKSLHSDWSPTQLIAQVLATTDAKTSLAGRTVSGGRLNIAGAVGAPPADTTGPRVVDSAPGGVIAGPVRSVRVTFNEAIAAASFTRDDLVSLTGPNGAINLSTATVTPAPGSGGRAFDITFSDRTTPGTYALVLGPQILDLASPGNPMDQDGDGVNGEATDDRFTARFAISERDVFTSGDTPLAIRDQVLSVIEVPRSLTIRDLDVQVTIAHPASANLDLMLTSPGGRRIHLAGPSRRSGADFRFTYFDDEAATSIVDAAPPFAGPFRPASALAAVDGSDARGFWTLQVVDSGANRTGKLLGWSLLIDGTAPPSNRPPVALDDAARTGQNVPVTVAVLANDSDPDNDPLTVRIVSERDGHAVVNDDQTVTFAPTAGFSGSASFVYEVDDGRGGTARATARIEVVFGNRPPDAQDDVAVVFTEEPTLFGAGAGPWIDLTANDSDPDGDPLRIVGVARAVNGTATLLGDGTIRWVPTAGFSGVGGFDYTLSDGSLTDSARVTLSVRSLGYVSTSAAGSLTGSDGITVSVSPSDILLVSVQAGTTPLRFYQTYFRGPSVGLTGGSEDVDAFAFLPDGSIVLSTLGAFNVPAPGGGTLTGNGEDLLRFVPTALGPGGTMGTWEIFFDGSDVGLSGSAENIDGVGFLADGRILLSTAGNVTVPGVSDGRDTDLLAFSGFQLGADTQGSWALYFDGSDVGLSDGTTEDVDALFVRDSASSLPTLYFSTRGNFSVPGVSGGGVDVVAFRPSNLGANTAGSYGPGLTFRGGPAGLTALGLDGYWLGRAPVVVRPSTGGFRAFVAPPAASGSAWDVAIVDLLLSQLKKDGRLKG